ncbi:MAG: hypothetical protein ACE5L7_10150, partial [Candidatus Aminicenantales bacterium]
PLTDHDLLDLKGLPHLLISVFRGERLPIHLQVEKIRRGEENLPLDLLLMLQEKIHCPAKMLQGNRLRIAQSLSSLTHSSTPRLESGARAWLETIEKIAHFPGEANSRSARASVMTFPIPNLSHSFRST